MGCDIHAVIEYQRYEGDRFWSVGGEFRPDRCYMLFSHMVGVRNGGDSVTPLTSPRGLPSDISFGASGIYEKQRHDAHNASWMTLDEFAESVRRTEEEAGRRVSPEYHAMLAAMRELPRVRVVFWFDN